MKKINIFKKAVYKGLKALNFTSQYAMNFMSSTELGGIFASSRNARTLEELYEGNSWIQLGVGTVAKSIASVDWELYKKTSKGREKQENHEFMTFFNSWNPIFDGGTSCRIAFQSNLELFGSSYVLLERNGKKVSYMYPVSKEDIKEKPQEKNDYMWKVKIGKEEWMIPYDDILCMKYINPLSVYGEGIGIVQTVVNNADIEENATDIIGSHLKNGGIPPYIIGMKSSETVGKAFKKKWEEEHIGPLNRGKPMFAGTNEITALKLQDSFADMGLIELKTHEKNSIREVFQIPPELYGSLENSNRATIEAALTIFATVALLPRLKLQKEFWNRLVKSVLGEGYELDFISPVPEDKEHKLKVMTSAPSSAFSLNDWREAGGCSRLEELEGKYEMPFNSQIIDVKDIKTSKLEKMIDECLEEYGKKSEKKFDIKVILDSLDSSVISETVNKTYISLIEIIGAEELKNLEIDVVFNIRNPRIEDYMKNQSGKRIKDITENIRKSLRKELEEAVANGEGTGSIKKRLKDVFDEKKSDFDLSRISRTETMSASNFAAQESYEQAGVEEKEWLSTRDESTRDTHASMDRKIIKVSENFDIEGDTAKSPGQFSQAKNNIHCRCTIAPVINKKSMFSEEKQIKAYWESKSTSAESFEKQFNKVYKKAFDKLEQAVMTKVEEVTNA